jgi:beta-galactosidase/beta-glucuronidase
MSTTTLPRPEHPRPQFTRPDWLCLNGEWQFEIDAGDSGLERDILHRDLQNRIIVPFCPESTLSGIGHTDFMHVVWYRRTVTIPVEWKDRDPILHFQAVDYDATVWAAVLAADFPADPNNRLGGFREVGRHRGGFSPFSCDLSGVAQAGDTVTIVVRARDENRAAQPRGKQAMQYAPHGCHYTRTTGIWQTVWLEPVPRVALKRPRITPDVANGFFRLEQPLTNNRPGLTLRATVRDDRGIVSSASCRADLDLAPRLDLPLPGASRRLWSISDPFLYDLQLELVDADGTVVDSATSYAGLRSIAIDGKKVKLNGETVFQRLVLDQGYYPEGVMTAPSDEALIRDITLSQEAGFNGARLHQKVFEERFLYHADRLGYLVWGEFGDWGCSGRGPHHDHQQPGSTYITQWLEVLERDYSHPSIIGWCPLNETWQELHDRITQLDDVTRGMFLAAKAMDTSRPVLDTSGYAHRVPEADFYDSHDYIGDADFATGLEKMRQRHARTGEDDVYTNYSDQRVGHSIPYRGQPYFVSEFGGFKWNSALAAKAAGEAVTGQDQTWGYGSDPATIEDFYHRFESVCNLLLENPYMFGYCYTQLTDVYPEENGIYAFDRSEKFDVARIRQFQDRLAAIEAE